ncbi:MAG: FecR domain-containing protein [Caulobacteraceae bacterium]|nr:FecR domain-containing protein [Caulobacteraceae bacterium]
MSDLSTDHEGARAERLVLQGLRAPLDAADAAWLDAWAAESPARMAMIDGWTRAWAMSGLIDPHEAAASDGAVNEKLGATATRRWAVAAGIAAAAAIPAAAWLGLRERARTYAAPADRSLTAALADGTEVVLSRGGRLEARFGGGRRSIRQLAGEAFYKVAKDPARPFQVEAGGYRLTALGTAFNVDPAPGGLHVDLVEGRLRIEPPGGAAAILLNAGERFRAEDGLRAVAADVDAARAWTEGRLVFDDESLGQVAASMARHSGRRLVFADSRLSGLRFSGVLRLDDLAAWKPAIEAVLPVELSETQGGYLVSARR